MNREELLPLLHDLLVAHSPGGEEAEIDRVALPYFEAHCEDVHVDAADNIVGKIPGRIGDDGLLVAAHKDELSVIVKRIEENGDLRVDQLGGYPPWKIGEGLMDVLLPDGEILKSVLSVGSLHTTSESPLVEAAREKALDWSMVRLVTYKTPDELQALGLRPGARAVIARERKPPYVWGDYVCGYALDDKAGLAVMLLTMKELAAGEPPEHDIYFAATSVEEILGGGASIVARRLPVERMLALEIGPVAEEYGLKNDERPVIWYKDRLTTYTKRFCDELAETGERLGFGAQRAVFSRGATDASTCRVYGHVGRVACLAFPGVNTHGYEVAHLDGIVNMQRLLITYLRDSGPDG